MKKFIGGLSYHRFKFFHGFRKNLRIPARLVSQFRRQEFAETAIKECWTASLTCPRCRFSHFKYRMELGNCVRYQIDCSTASITEDESIPNVETMRVKPMEGINSSGFLWIELMDWHYNKISTPTGSETNNISFSDVKQAFWQACKVFSLATSDQMAGTVMQNSTGMVRRIAAPRFCSSVYIRCPTSAVR